MGGWERERGRIGGWERWRGLRVRSKIEGGGWVDEEKGLEMDGREEGGEGRTGRRDGEIEVGRGEKIW